MPMTLAFSCEVVHTKNYENPSIFVKVTAKNQWHLFFWTRCILGTHKGQCQDAAFIMRYDAE